MTKIDYKYLSLALLLNFVVFANSLFNGFVNWDDPANFLNHPVISSDMGIFEAFKAIFSTTVIGNYNPLSTASFLIDKTLFGFENPWGWHLINLILHLVNVGLVYLLSKRLGLHIIAALIVAVLFGIHPMRVESVAWVTERKDVLFAMFYLLAILQYIKYKSTRGVTHLVLLIILFALSLLSKIQAVSLPLSLLAIDYLQSGKWLVKDWLTKWYLFAMSLAIGILGIYFLDKNSSLAIDYVDTSLIDNILLAGYTLFVYLYKFLIPFPLSPYYQYPESLEIKHYAGVLAFVSIGAAMWQSYSKDRKWVFFGLFFFLVNVVFVLQWVKAGQGYLADRFTYVAYLGLFMIVGSIVNYWVVNNRFSTFKKIVLMGVVIVFGGLTYSQNMVWKDGESLWTKSIKVNPKSARSYAARGTYYARKGLGTKALDDYNKSMAIKEIPEVKENRAKLLMSNSRDQNDSRQALNDLLSFENKTATQYINIGALYVMLADNASALKYYKEGMVKYPNEFNLPLNAGRVLQGLTRFDEALDNFNKAIQLNPTNYEAYFEKGRQLRNFKQLNEALGPLTKAIQLAPDFCKSYYERSMLYANAGQLELAKVDLKKAIDLNCESISENYKSQLGF